MTAALIRKSVKFWQDKTCISFQENGGGPNRLFFEKQAGCYSYVGRITSFPRQTVSIGSGCEHVSIYRNSAYLTYRNTFFSSA
jgi:hypothetical protein